jgi:anti-sigma factor RsiW
MRFVPQHNMLCERGREWISLRLDGELSELAQKMLDSHLARCAACRAFEADVAATTEFLRATPLERLEQPLSLPRGRRLALSTRRVSAVAASAAAVVLGIAAFLNVPSSGSTATVSPVRVVQSNNNDLREQKLLRATVLSPVVADSHGPQQT